MTEISRPHLYPIKCCVLTVFYVLLIFSKVHQWGPQNKELPARNCLRPNKIGQRLHLWQANEILTRLFCSHSLRLLNLGITFCKNVFRQFLCHARVYTLAGVVGNILERQCLFLNKIRIFEKEEECGFRTCFFHIYTPIWISEVTCFLYKRLISTVIYI